MELSTLARPGTQGGGGHGMHEALGSPSTATLSFSILSILAICWLAGGLGMLVGYWIRVSMWPCGPLWVWPLPTKATRPALVCSAFFDP